jgi:uncharacterized protein GlcG (DUF336 family)
MTKIRSMSCISFSCISFSCISVAALVLSALATPAAHAQGLVNAKRVSAELAAEAVAAAVQGCAEKKFSVSATLLDFDGVQQASLRGDGTGPENLAIANDKAYTAVTFQTDTAEIVARSRTGPVSSSFTKVPHLVLASGAIVIKVGDEVIGALGVSGAPGGDNDALCAKAGLDKIRDRLK